MNDRTTESFEIDITVVVQAKRRRNPTGITLHKGTRYRVSCDPAAQWQDGHIRCNADGWHTSQLHWPTRWLVHLAERQRILPHSNWFILTGLYASHPDSRIPLGSRLDFTAQHSDALLLCANDVPWMYWNNRGELPVRIRRLQESTA